MIDIISFDKALENTNNVKRHLLLGNGFSISLFPDIFKYDSLFEQTDFSQWQEIKKVFESLKTTDFEVVIHALRQTALLMPLYSDDKILCAKVSEHAENLKISLIKTISDCHPGNPSDIEEEQYQACRKFLANFIGKNRNKKEGNIYTLSYDLLLYWTLLHEKEKIDFSKKSNSEEGILEHDDGFRAPDDDLKAEYVTWDGEGNYSQRIYYLHGALHLYDYGYELQKKCWERSGGKTLISQINSAFDKGRFPLFVSEGSSKDKLKSIRHSAYLHKCMRSFRGVCESKSISLFIFGHSLAENDDHILKQIIKGKIPDIYISMYGDPTAPENQKIIYRASKLIRDRNEFFPLSIKFFDAASANVWAIQQGA